jgi:hypothetical protein
MDDAWAERIWNELRRIANSLEALTEPPTAEPETPTCPHPEDQRISFGVTNGQADWQCRICQFRTPCLPLDRETTIRGHP